ncbi:pantoate--beta-alanine ligase [Mesorhizobium sp. M2A.F.Ca.ET.043.05.1.1]|uniref:pantoate--beta-alanine ligase n=1 Tax=unclassified Mesorhizobium TaxID=325217 RepID=UPI0032B256B3
MRRLAAISTSDRGRRLSVRHDSLALSSRNMSLSAIERLAASKLAEILFDAAEGLSAGAPTELVLAEAKEAMIASG